MLRVVALVSLIVLGATSAHADTLCAPRTDLLEYLRDTYAETPAASGSTAEGGTVEILVSRRGSWTMVVTAPSGEACARATGDNWRSLPPPRWSL